MPLIVDASVTMAWCFKDETTQFTDSILRRVRHEGARQPSIWLLEIANAMLIGERRGRLTEAETVTFVQTLQELPINVESYSLGATWSSTIELGRRSNLSSYDASYVDLAVRDGLTLVTMDKRMAKVASEIGVDVIEPPSDAGESPGA